jgi:hypothetical protein
VKNNLGRLDLPSLRYRIDTAWVDTEEGQTEVGKLLIDRPLTDPERSLLCRLAIETVIEQAGATWEEAVAALLTRWARTAGRRLTRHRCMCSIASRSHRAVRAGRRIFVVEGEKDVHALESLGAVTRDVSGRTSAGRNRGGLPPLAAKPMGRR